MQLTREQREQALRELLEMLAAHPEGLRTGDLLRTKSFRNRRELTPKQVGQLLATVPEAYQQPSRRVIAEGEWKDIPVMPPSGWEGIRVDEIGLVDYANLWRLKKP